VAEFMLLICDDEKARAALPDSEIAASYAKVGVWWQEQERSGRIVAGSGRRLQRSSTAKTVRVEAARAVVTDGSFAETKELVGGFALVNAPDIDAVVDMLKSWPGLEVVVEVRPVLAG
jgi:hypothetical protein